MKLELLDAAANGLVLRTAGIGAVAVADAAAAVSGGS
jgi:hypothetical protein